MDDARRANLAGKPPWKMYPRQMLLARASAELARAIFPDAIAGLVATEELEDDPDAAQVGNGVEPTPPPTRRRRRTTVTTSESAPAPSAPSPGGEPVPAPDESAPAEARSASSPVESAEVSEPRVTGAALPPEEQAVIDEALEIGATPVEPEADEPTPISDPQRRKIHALFREQNISDRGERLKICGQILDRDVPTSTGLTSEEASRIIDQLSSNVEDTSRLAELDQLVADSDADTHELWVQVAGYRHKLVDALVAEIDPSGHAAWKTLRDTLKAEEITDLTGYLKTRGEEGTDDSF
jgi:hypothetical protein